MILEGQGHIVSDPDMLFGKPRIAGTRFAVKDVVIYHLFQGMALESISAKWNIPLGAIHSALAYYYDHKAEFDKSFEEDRAYVAKLKAEQSAHPRIS